MQKHSMASLWRASLFQAAHQRQLSVYLSKWRNVQTYTFVDLTTRGLST
jgi:hypothetical protein